MQLYRTPQLGLIRPTPERKGVVIASWLTLLTSQLVVACSIDPTTAAVGSPCTPIDEYRRDFAGFSASEVNIESGNPDCPVEAVCLTNRFRGRVSCPYGQTEANMTPSGDTAERCYIPGGDGQLVTVAVEPQLIDTRGTRGVYCSALCADAKGHRSDGRNYHDCPHDYHCESLVYLFPKSNLYGSYCVRNDTPTQDTLSPASCIQGAANCDDVTSHE